jgi:hypothetical protein
VICRDDKGFIPTFQVAKKKEKAWLFLLFSQQMKIKKLIFLIISK